MEDFSLENASVEDKAALAAVLKAYKVPGAKKLIQKALKEANPDLDIPELELENRIEKEVGGARKELQDFKDSLAKEKLTAKLEAARESLKAQDFTDEDIKAIEEMMQKESIPSHATAAKLFKLERQAAMPTPQVDWKARKEQKFVIPEEAMKTTGSLTQWAHGEAAQAIDEIKAAR